jgi:hypothetical protein
MPAQLSIDCCVPAVIASVSPCYLRRYHLHTVPASAYPERYFGHSLFRQSCHWLAFGWHLLAASTIGESRPVVTPFRQRVLRSL